MRIWVDSDVLKFNRAKGRNDPPIIVEISGQPRRHVRQVQVAPGVVMKYDRACTGCGVVALYVTDEAAVQVVLT